MIEGEYRMKRIEVIVRNAELSEIRYALRDFGITTMRVTEVEKEFVPEYRRNSERQAELEPETEKRSKVSVVVPDEEADSVVLMFVSTLKDGGINDGKGFVSSIEYVVRLEADGFFDNMI